jgi:hypothetical protein
VTLGAGTYCAVVSAGSSTVPASFTPRVANSALGQFRLDLYCSGNARRLDEEALLNSTNAARPASALAGPARLPVARVEPSLTPRAASSARVASPATDLEALGDPTDKPHDLEVRSAGSL